MNTSLDLLLRKNKGKAIMPEYENLFLNAGFRQGDLVHISLSDSDQIIDKIKELASQFKSEYESISANSNNFHNSRLLYSTYEEHKSHVSYIYTDSYIYCGMYEVESELGIQFALDIAYNDEQHTCFLVDKNLAYAFTINYYNGDHSDNPNTFDIQRRILI